MKKIKAIYILILILNSFTYAYADEFSKDIESLSEEISNLSTSANEEIKNIDLAINEIQDAVNFANQNFLIGNYDLATKSIGFVNKSISEISKIERAEVDNNEKPEAADMSLLQDIGTNLKEKNKIAVNKLITDMVELNKKGIDPFKMNKTFAKAGSSVITHRDINNFINKNAPGFNQKAEVAYWQTIYSVSYTHLTLPTTPYV